MSTLPLARSGGGLSSAAMARNNDANLRKAVTRRLKRVERLLNAVSRDAPPSERSVHALRVATRRARAALTVAAPMLDARTLRSTERALKQVRRSAADARACDVDQARFADMLEQRREPPRASVDLRPAIAYALGRLAGERRAAVDRLRQAAAKSRVKRLRRVRTRVASQLREGSMNADSARARLADAVSDAVAAVRGAGESVRHAPRLDAVHEARIAAKRLRYTVEFAGEAIGRERDLKPLVKALASIQDDLGRVNDAGERAARLTAWLEAPAKSPTHAPPEALRRQCLALTEALARERDDALGETLAAWPAFASDRIDAALRQASALADAIRQGEALTLESADNLQREAPAPASPLALVPDDDARESA